jgi:SAM-dependent methyltransferase
VKLNLGCGLDFRAGYINLDLWAEKVDIHGDIRERLPFDNETFSEIYASGIFEQIGPNEQFRFALNECHRVLINGGEITIVVPHAAFPIAFRDPFDCRRFTEQTWEYFIKGNHYWDHYGKLYGFAPWQSFNCSVAKNGIMTAILKKES